MPLDALPTHLRDVENHFPDDEQFGTTTLFGKLYRWYQKKTKTWFAFSYRCSERWARWRHYPKVLFAVCDSISTFRYENEQGEDLDIGWRRFLWNTDVQIWKTSTSFDGAPLWNIQPAYLSRIQYYSRWHFAIQWPLMISFHFYGKRDDVPVWGELKPDLDGKLLFGYWNHFDADLIYWMLTSAYIGRNFK